MSDTEQLDILTALAALPQRFACPTCRGNRQMLRVLYPDEALERGALTEICECRTCRGRGWVGYDPDDRSVIPF
jgi:hypothetical protein